MFEESYCNMVKRLAKPGEEILKSLTSEKVHMWHMATGISGEAGEIVEAVEINSTRPMSEIIKHLTEELGDLTFYLHGFCQGLDLPVPKGRTWPCQNLGRLATNVSVSASKLLDYTKKACVYNKHVDIELFYDLIQEIADYISCICSMIKVMEQDVRSQNQYKLSVKRYPRGYSDKAAQERADKDGERA